MYREVDLLFCDDSTDDVFFLKRGFLAAGINARMDEVRSGEEAVDFLLGRGAFKDRRVPHLVVLDIKMPGMDGLEVLSWVRDQEGLRTVPVLIMSSSDDTRDIDEAHRRGANGYLVKPHAGAGYREVACGIEAYWLKCNHYPSSCGAPCQEMGGEV